MEKRSELSQCWRVAMAITLLLLWGGNACAEESSEVSLDWDCWIQVENNPVSISCIRDRGSLAQQPTEDQEAILENLLLDHIHHMIHAENTSGLGQFISKNVSAFREGSFWNIFIYTVPYDDSWINEHPQILVRALLCPGHLLCTVNIQRPH